MKRSGPLKRGKPLVARKALPRRTTKGDLRRATTPKRKPTADTELLALVPEDLREIPRWGRSQWEAANVLLTSRCCGRCEVCGAAFKPGEVIERQHRKRRREGGDWLHNLLMCHRECHARLHANPVWARENGWIVSAFSDPLNVPVRLWGASWVYLDATGGTSTAPPK